MQTASPSWWTRLKDSLASLTRDWRSGVGL
jgi:hypothetical protein